VQRVLLEHQAFKEHLVQQEVQVLLDLLARPVSLELVVFRAHQAQQGSQVQQVSLVLQEFKALLVRQVQRVL